jgi:hypothetical protein
MRVFPQCSFQDSASAFKIVHSDMKLRKQGLLAGVVPAIGPGGVTRDESHWARLAKKGHKRGELCEKCLRAMVFQAVLSGRGRSCRSREPVECRNEKSHDTRSALVYKGTHPGRRKQKSGLRLQPFP